MVFVDPRDGSCDLAEPLRKLGLEVIDDEQIPADVMFTGRGLGGAPVEIGIEYKKLSELIQSLRTERLQGYQLPTMRAKQADGRARFDHAYLLVQGERVFDARGMLLKRTSKRTFRPLPGHMTLGELYKRTHVMHLRGGLNPAFVDTRADAARWIEALYRVWTDKDLDKHRSHLGIYNPEPLEPMSGFQRRMIGFPGVGPKLAEAAERKFKTIRRAVNASPAEWAELTTEDDRGKTRKFGMAHARKLEEAFR